ncbi:hypothetical protein [uncultured Gammaproteobacteria bacterium]|nr:hypothetical protein [uncultured Gammaproteobacteria bacterium]
MDMDGFTTFALTDMDGFTTFALTGRDGFVTHPCEFAIVRKGYKPFPTFGCVVGGKLFLLLIVFLERNKIYFWLC